MLKSLVSDNQWNSNEALTGCHLLEASSVPALELASALDKTVPTLAWRPQMQWFDLFTGVVETKNPDPPVTVIDFPLQRGYSHPLMDRISKFHRKLLHQLLRHSRQPAQCPLICVSPFFVPVAEQWPGPVVYHSLDLIYAYEGLNAPQVLQLERRMCRVAHLVSSISGRIADFLVEQAGCDPGKLQIIPNATRATNVRDSVSYQPDALLREIHDLKRPVVGVIGNMASNLDWELLQSAVEKTPGFSWAFIGPTSMPIAEKQQQQARAAVMSIRDRVRFTGSQPYGVLQGFARSFDVAVLPYRRREPTYSGNAMRFYEHLAACRPMLATPNFAELQKKAPLVCLINNADELASKLHKLKAVAFRDGYEEARWLASQKETWDARAETMLRALRSVGQNRNAYFQARA